MIPSDVASRLQVSADAALRPVAPAQEIADRLSGLVAGQKVMAEIQSMLPNGTYRALINQRSITLALPFAAKSGDSLELQVTESDGKLALAIVAAANEGGQPAAATTSATLSRTGQLISSLFAEARDAGGSKAAATLNANAPLGATPVSAQELLPQLKQAITQSGMFYESHQAEWVEGRFSKAALLQEPQGKLSSPATLAAQAQADAALPVQASNTPPPATNLPASALPADEAAAPLLPKMLTGASDMVAAPASALTADEAAAPLLAKALADAGDAGDAVTAHTSEAATDKTAAPLPSKAPIGAGEVVTARHDTSEVGNASTTPPQAQSKAPGQLVAPQAQALVQQQLEALATQNFSWQGQIWPGQEMRWEIEEDAAHRDTGGDETAAKWATRLHLTLPNLGEVDAHIRLQGNEITLSMTAGSEATRTLMRAARVALRSQLDQAGITLASMGVAAAEQSDG